jgi:hypothetical protein
VKGYGNEMNELPEELSLKNEGILSHVGVLHLTDREIHTCLTETGLEEAPRPREDNHGAALFKMDKNVDDPCISTL